MPSPQHIALHYEELLAGFELHGHVGMNEGPIPEPFTVQDNKVNRHIRTDQDWWCYFNWETTGPLNHCMCGTWVLKVMLEKMGGEEFDLPDSEREINFTPEPKNYRAYMKFAPDCVPEGIYKPVISLTFKGPKGVFGPVAAFGEGPMVQFYKVG